MSTAKIVHLDSHQAVQALLPWYVTGQLSGEEQVRVAMHLADCPRCQADLELERKLQAAHREITTGGDVESGLEKLRRQITARAPRRRALGLAQRLRIDWRDGAAWMRWALGVQSVALAAIGVLAVVMILPSAPDDAYRGLGAASAGSASGSAVTMFKPDATEQEIRRALTRSGARLIGGPTVTGAYLLALPAGHERSALAELRAQPAVVLAESLDAKARP